MDATTIEIALASDSRFFPGLFMTACSIAHFADRNVKLVFHVLDGGIPQAKKNHLREVLNAHHPSVQINWLSIDIQSFKDLPEWRGCGKMNWARLLLPKLLPESKWVVYLDTDFLCLHDIAKLWASKSDDAALLSVPDDWLPYVESERAWFQARNIHFDERKCICSGLLLLNLRRFRNLHLDELVLAAADRFRNTMNSVDQSAINITFSSRNDLFLLPHTWQTFTRSMTKEDLLARPFLHFAGDAPWVCFRVNRIFNDAGVLWFKIYARFRGTTYWNALREFYSIGEIFKYRALYLLFSRIPCLQKLLFLYFRLIKHSETIEIYKALLHRFETPEIDYFFRKA